MAIYRHVQTGEFVDAEVYKGPDCMIETLDGVTLCESGDVVVLGKRGYEVFARDAFPRLFSGPVDPAKHCEAETAAQVRDMAELVVAVVRSAGAVPVREVVNQLRGNNDWTRYQRYMLGRLMNDLIEQGRLVARHEAAARRFMTPPANGRRQFTRG